MSLIIAYLMKLLANPQVLIGLGVAGGVLAVFLKGRSSGEASIQSEIADAAQSLNKEIHATENDNQKVENQKNETIQNIDDITDPAVLTSMLNDLTAGKAPGNKPDKS
jgi:hypothetical protein